MINKKSKSISEKKAKELLSGPGSRKILEDIENIEKATQKEEVKQDEDVWLVGDASSDFQSLKIN